MMKIQAIILIAFLQIQGYLAQYSTNIKFIASRRGSGGPTSIETFTNLGNQAQLNSFCSTANNLTFLVHAWQENTAIWWRTPMTNNFLDRRGGCIIWIDYSYYSICPYSSPTSCRLFHYPVLVNNFNGIVDVLKQKMLDLRGFGYAVKDTFMYGFSFGAHVTTEAAYRFKTATTEKIRRVDVCEPAGPLFSNTSSSSVINAAGSITNFQVIHTTNVLGAGYRYGGKSVNMGICGTNQPSGADDKAKHYLSIQYYLNAFTINFPFVSRSTINSAYGLTGSNQCKNPPASLPDGPFTPANRMGYNLDFSVPDGTYFAYAGATSPYNV